MQMQEINHVEPMTRWCILNNHCSLMVTYDVRVNRTQFSNVDRKNILLFPCKKNCFLFFIVLYNIKILSKFSWWTQFCIIFKTSLFSRIVLFA